MLQRSKIANAAGPRNNYITVQKATDSAANSYDEVLPTFTNYCNVWASCISKSGKEFIAAKTVEPMLDSMLELAFDSVTSQITPRDRVIFQGRTLNIIGAYDPTNNREKIVLEVVEPVQC